MTEKELKDLVIDGETYNVKSFLGKGGFGAVYKYTDSKGKVVAVKKIENKTAIKEVDILRKVKGPEFEHYFVQFYKIFKSSNCVTYIVMEYCAGGSLNDYVKEVKKLDIITARKFLAHLIKGLQKLHSIGLMHRDLKPGNILMTSASTNAILKIADFGLSRDAPEFSAYLSQCGTQCYMAPEIVEGRRYDKSADIYSLGGIMYFMERGIHPLYLSFDKCGYPIFTGNLEGYSHNSVAGRMMCKRKEERIKLDELKFNNNKFNFTTTKYCKVCGEKLSAEIVYKYVGNKWKYIDEWKCCSNNCVNNNNPTGICPKGNGFPQIKSNTEMGYIYKTNEGNKHVRIESENCFTKPINEFIQTDTLYYYEIKLIFEKNEFMWIGFRIGNRLICLYLILKSIYLSQNKNIINLPSLNYKTNDIIGCGLVYPPLNILNKLPYIFFTLNGKQIGKAILIEEDCDAIRPYVFLYSCSIEANFGENSFIYNVSKHCVANEFYKKEEFE